MSTFIVIDGADGSGKATQVALLTERLRNEGKSVETIDFPRYESNHFGQLLRECLDGKRGDFLSLDPKIASVLYAADRYESAEQIQDWLAAGSIVIADRYVSANMLHQGGKLSDAAEQAEFLAWLDKTEHEIFSIKRPDVILYLDVPYSFRQKMMQEDAVRGELDSVEIDAQHQEQTEVAAQRLVANLNDWHPVNCVKDNALRSREDIHGEVYDIVSQLLQK